MTRRSWHTLTPLDRARSIARGYRDLAIRHAPPEQVAKLDHLATAVGEQWVVEWLDTGSERISHGEFAQLAGVKPGTLSAWHSRPPSWGAPPPRGADGLYDRQAAVDYLRARDERGVYQPPDWPPPADLVRRVTTPPHPEGDTP